MINIPSLGHEQAELATRVIRDEMLGRNLRGVIAVADAAGELISLLRLDDAPRPSILIATNKAWTSARERKSTRELGQKARDPDCGFDMAFFGDSRYVGWGGGLPVVQDGRVIGAVAVSGLTEDLDEELSRIGISAILGAKGTER